MGDSFYQLALKTLPHNWKEARRLVYEGASKGDQMCMWWLGDAARQMYWDVKETPEHWYLKADNDRGYVDHILLIQSHGFALLGSDKIIQKIREGNDYYAIARSNLINGFRGSHDDIVINFKKADDIFSYYHLFYDALHPKYSKKAAELGYAPSQHSVACNLEYKNIDEKLYWYKRAAEQEYKSSQYELSSWYMGFKIRNPAGSLYWLKKLTNSKHYDFGKYIVEMKSKYKQEFDKIERCQSTCFQLLCVRQFRQSILSVIPKDVIRMIVKILWSTREDEEWEVK